MHPISLFSISLYHCHKFSFVGSLEEAGNQCSPTFWVFLTFMDRQFTHKHTHTSLSTFVYMVHRCMFQISEHKYACQCMCMCVCVYESVCLCIWTRGLCRVLLNLCSLYFLSQDVSLNLWLTDSAALASQLAPWIPCSIYRALYLFRGINRYNMKSWYLLGVDR